jgi:hypothetical protein
MDQAILVPKSLGGSFVLDRPYKFKFKLTNLVKLKIITGKWMWGFSVRCHLQMPRWSYDRTVLLPRGVLKVGAVSSIGPRGELISIPSGWEISQIRVPYQVTGEMTTRHIINLLLPYCKILFLSLFRYLVITLVSQSTQSGHLLQRWLKSRKCHLSCIVYSNIWKLIKAKWISRPGRVKKIKGRECTMYLFWMIH